MSLSDVKNTPVNNTTPQQKTITSTVKIKKGKIGGRKVTVKKKDPAVTEVGLESIKKAKLTAGEKVRRFFKKIGDGLKKCCEKICALFAKICCCCCLDDEDDDYEEPFVTPAPIDPSRTSTGKKPSHSSFKKPVAFTDLRELSNKIDRALDYSAEKRDKISDDAIITLQKQIESMAELKGQLNELANQLAELPGSGLEGIPPRGQDNVTGNSCYMNASMQMMEHMYARNNPACAHLIEQNLSLGERTLEQMEDELLHQWMPVPAPLSTEVRQKIENEIKDREAKLAALKGTSFSTRQKAWKFKQDIRDFRQQLRYREDAIFFKWSFLLVLQAKKFVDEDHNDLIENALNYHINLLFAQQQTQEFKNPLEIRHQMDAAPYVQMACRFLDKTFLLNIKKKSEEECISDKSESYGVFGLNFPGTEKSYNFADLITHTIDDPRGEPFYKEDDKGNVITYDNFVTYSRIAGTPPEVLHFQLSRFSQDEQGNGKKNDAEVVPHFNLQETVDFSKLFVNETPSHEGTYRLESFVHQRGTLKAGHYKAFIRMDTPQDDKTWYCLNDSAVTAMTDEEVLPSLKEAYILGFKKVAPSEEA